MRWVVLLRAVNLGARNKVPMAQLRTLLEEEAGYRDVRTYIASGNVLVDGPRGKAAVARKLESLIGRRVQRGDNRDRAHAEGALGRCRRPPVRAQHSRSHVVFLADRPTAKAAESLATGEQLPGTTQSWRGRHLRPVPGCGVQGARLSAARLERLLDVPGTHRNWRTVNALAELAAEA